MHYSVATHVITFFTDDGEKLNPYPLLCRFSPSMHPPSMGMNIHEMTSEMLIGGHSILGLVQVCVCAAPSPFVSQ